MSRRLLTASRGGGSIIHPSYDEEFTGTLSRWTEGNVEAGGIVNGSNGPITRGTVQRYGASEVEMTTYSVMLLDSIPAPPFTVTAHASYLLFDDIYADYGANMLSVGGFTNAAALGSRHYAIQWDIAFLGEIGIIDGTWESYVNQASQSNYVKLGDDHAFEIPNWLRLVVHSGTNIDAYYSTDGTNWTGYITGKNPNVAVESIALWSYAATTRWDWVRFT